MSLWRDGRRSSLWWLLAGLGAGLVVLDLYGQVHHGVATWKTWFFLATMSLGMAAGLWVWAWRTKTRMGPVMYWWPALFVAFDLSYAYPASRLALTIGLALFTMGPIAYSQMTLSYPNGRLEGRLAWIYIFVLAYGAQVVQNLYNLLVLEGSYLYVGAPPFSLEWWNRGWSIEVMAVIPIGLWLVWRKLLRSAPGARRTFLPLALALTVASIFAEIVAYTVVAGDQDALVAVTSYDWIITASAAAGVLGSFIGLYAPRLARGTMGDLVVALDRAEPGAVGRSLARAIGDPSLELALWLPERRCWVDEQGRELSLPRGPDRAVTMIGKDLAAIVHDPVFLDQPAMLEAVGSAARFALENERLHAELRLQLAELRESRARIVRAGDEERRRLERDLHDGAQQRLLGVGMALQLLRASRDDERQRLLDETDAEVQAALAELRELARGIHPAVLTDHGLGPAIRTLAERSPLPVEVGASDERLAGEIETAVYFIVAEALANVAKHARASKARVSVARENGIVRVEVSDDGVGGAAPDGGTGLRGLADRAGALDGKLVVESLAGYGTRVVAEIPCAS
jgi:signal transduction histidine kinase